MTRQEFGESGSAQPEEKRAKLVFAVPTFDAQINPFALETTVILLDHPEGLTQFRQDMQDKLFLAEVNNDVNSQETLRGYLTAINNNLTSTEIWEHIDQKPITPEAGIVLLDNLPNLKERDELLKQTDQKLLIDTTEALASGIITKRFGKESNWRDAFNNLYSIYQAAARSQDPGTINKFFDLLLGDYKKVMPQDSISWGSLSLAKAAIAPEDEDLLTKHSELNKSITLMAEITGRKDDRDRLAQDVSVRILQLGAARTVIYLGMDPNSGEGRDLYKAIIVGNRRDDKDKKRYGNFNVNKIMLKRLTPDQLEVAQLLAQNNEREEIYNSVAGTDEEAKRIFTTRVMPDDPDELSRFPYNVILHESEDRRILRSILDKAIIKQQLYQIAEEFASKYDERWDIIPFAQANLQGYLVMNPKYGPRFSQMSAKEQVLHIQSLIKEHNIHQFWEDIKGKQIVGGETSFIREDPENGFIFVLSKQEYTSKSQLETSLDLSVPDAVRRRSIELLGGLVKQRYQIPRNFTKLPTMAGDEYALESNNQMPGVFKQAIIKKETDGGLRFEMETAADSNGLELQTNMISGSVTFPQDRIYVSFDEVTENLPQDLKWVIESALLSLVERTCCRPLSEEIIERKLVSPEDERLNETESTSSGGFLVHVGGFRKSGARKQFTSYAESNFNDAMEDLERDTRGLSLVFINNIHRVKVPKCERYLTWNKGWESGDEQPIKRQSPNKLIALDN